MAEEENYQNPEHDPEKAAEDKARKRRNVLFVVVGLLVLLNGFLGYKYFAKKQEAEQTQQTLMDTRELKEELEAEKKEFQNQVKGLKGQNAKLDSMLANKNQKLQEKEQQVRELLQERKIRVEKYREAREELEKYRYYTQKYQNQVDSLKRRITELREENQNLESEVRETRKEKSQLKDENVKLKNKVALGKRLKLKEASVSGIKIQNDGDKKETNNVNKIDQIKVCFKFQDNPIAESGPRNILIKILNPKGETVYIKSRGSGQFSYKGDTALYTYSNKINFDNKDQMHCSYWSKGSEFSEGEYKAEIFTNGYLIGRKTFKLESGFLNLF